MRVSSKVLIISAAVILFFLVLINVILVAGNKKATENVAAPQPSPGTVESLSKLKFLNEYVKLTPTLSPSQIASLNGQIKSVSEDQEDDLSEFINKLPHETDDYKLEYSDLTGKFYVQRKTDKAEDELKKFLAENNLAQFLPQFRNIFVFGDKQTDEKKLLQEKDKETEEKLDLFDQIQKEAGPDDQTLKPLVDFFRALNKDLDVPSDFENLNEAPTPTPTPSGDNGGGGGGNGGGVNIIGDVSSLNAVITEAATQTKTPTVILKTVMQIECGYVFGLSDKKIADYSRPGGGLQPGDPCYGANSAGAVGPAQFLPSTWIIYSHAINKFGGYTHRPNIRNIRDAAYAAGDKLKRDSLAHDLNWNFQEVRRAIICYNAGCGNLGSPPSHTIAYFNKVWDAYSRSR